MAKDDPKVPAKKTSQANVEAFLEKVRLTPVNKISGQRGRLLFAMDAIQLAFYRGFGEFNASRWTTDEKALLRQMTSVSCLAGETQIGKVLAHAVNETKKQKINALVFVGDCFEEDIDHAGMIAGDLGLLGVPAFMFHEGGDLIAAYAFKQVAKLTNGAYCQFDSNSAQVLKDLLSAVAVYAAGGRPALEDMARKRGGEVLKLVHQVNTKDR